MTEGFPKRCGTHSAPCEDKKVARSVAMGSATEGFCMKYNHNKSLVNIGRMLRKNMTKEERHLWYDYLRGYPVRFIRQKIIGNYIVDFYCAKAKIVIELDGSQHYEDKGLQTDQKRDNYLNSLGITVLRYSNLDINKNFRGVCLDILNHISTSSASLRSAPSPQGEGSMK